MTGAATCADQLCPADLGEAPGGRGGRAHRASSSSFWRSVPGSSDSAARWLSWSAWM